MADLSEMLTGAWDRLTTPTRLSVNSTGSYMGDYAAARERGMSPERASSFAKMNNPEVVAPEPGPVARALANPTAEKTMFLMNFLSPVMRSVRSPYARIPGTPKTFKLPGGEVLPTEPIPAVVRAEEAYRKAAGLPPGPRQFDRFDPQAAKGYARAFEEMPHAPHSPEVRRAYDAMIDEAMGQYRALRDQGIEPSFMQRDAAGNVVDPYAKSPALLYKDLREGRMQVFPTEAGYGSSGAMASHTNPMLRPTGESWGGQPVVANDIFRFVHDAYGHGRNPFFRAPGEERAYQLHASMFSPEARRALAAETRGQNSYLNFGPHAKHNASASGADTIYSPQKIGVMPRWATEANLPPPDLPVASTPRWVAPPQVGILAQDEPSLASRLSQQ